MPREEIIKLSVSAAALFPCFAAPEWRPRRRRSGSGTPSPAASASSWTPGSASGATFRGECALVTESSAGCAGIEADFGFGVRPLPYWGDVEREPQITIVGGASLWVMSGHEDEEYVRVAEFPNYLSSPEVQAQWHQETSYLPITIAACEPTRERPFTRRTRAPTSRSSR